MTTVGGITFNDTASLAAAPHPNLSRISLAELGGMDPEVRIEYLKTVSKTSGIIVGKLCIIDEIPKAERSKNQQKVSAETWKIIKDHLLLDQSRQDLVKQLELAGFQNHFVVLTPLTAGRPTAATGTVDLLSPTFDVANLPSEDETKASNKVYNCCTDDAAERLALRAISGASTELVLKCCEPSLARRLKNMIPVDANECSGALVYRNFLHIHGNPTNRSALVNLIGRLEEFSVTVVPGQNIKVFSDAIKPVLQRLALANINLRPPELLVRRMLSTCTVERFKLWLAVQVTNAATCLDDPEDLLTAAVTEYNNARKDEEWTEDGAEIASAYVSQYQGNKNDPDHLGGTKKQKGLTTEQLLLKALEEEELGDTSNSKALDKITARALIKSSENNVVLTDELPQKAPSMPLVEAPKIRKDLIGQSHTAGPGATRYITDTAGRVIDYNPPKAR